MRHPRRTVANAEVGPLRVDFIDGKSQRIELFAKPFAQILVVTMFWIADRLQKIVEAGKAAAVLGQSVKFAGNAKLYLSAGSGVSTCSAVIAWFQLSPKSYV